MSARSTSVRPSLAALFSWGSVPGSPGEVRAFLQRRISIYLVFTSAFWAVAWLLATLLTALTRPEDASAKMTALLLGMVLGLAALWWFGRRKERSTRWLFIADLAATALQGVLIAFLLRGMLPLIRYRPDIIFIHGVTCVLVARAAVVPSTPTRTVLVGVLACFPICAATLLVYRMAFAMRIAVANFYPGDRSTPEMFFLWSMVYCSLAIALSAFVSFVVYGLQRAVQQARQLGQYTLEQKIGEGGMGVVYRGRHALLRRATALKLLHPERAGAGNVARFEREVQITSQLTHPNTVAIYDYGRTPENLFYYAMEYLDGIDLEELVRKNGPLPAGRVRHLIQQVLGSLAEAHASGIIHRDIKPSNVFICERGLIPDFVKVLDFGLARDLDARGGELTQADQLTGTPLYMCPEQILGAKLDGRSDLYPVGALAYFLITGTPVFSGTNVVEICSHHLHSTVEPPSKRLGAPVPAALESAVLACLEKDPARRPQDAAAALALFEANAHAAPWTQDDSRRWWLEHGAQLRARQSEGAPAAGKLTLEVALERRLASI